MLTNTMHGPIPRIIEPLEGAPINGLGEHQVGPSYYPVDFFTALHPPILSSAGANVNQLTLPSPGFSSSRQTSHWSTAKPARIGRGAHRGRKQPSTIGFLHGISNGTLPPPRTNFFRGSNASSFNEYARSSGSSGFRSTNSTPPIQNLHDVASHPFLLLSHDTAGGSFQQRRHSIPSTASGVLPYLIDLHVAAASAVQVHNGPETHIIQGPASVTIMSNCSNPPTAVPVTVPPGQYVQQLIDERGVLRTVYISSQPFSESATAVESNIPNGYYVPLQMPVQGTAGNFSARMNVPRRLQVSPQTTSTNNVNGLPPQNGMSPQSNFSQEYHGFSQQNLSAPDDRNYQARQKLKKKYDNKSSRSSHSVTYSNRNYAADSNNDPFESHDIRKFQHSNHSRRNGDSHHLTNGSGDADRGHSSASVSPQVSSEGHESEEGVLRNFFSTVRPVTVENVKARSVSITCTPLDFTQLDTSLLEKFGNLREGDLEYYVCCGEPTEKQRIFTAGTAPQLTLQLVELRPHTEYLVSAQVGIGDLKGKQSEPVTFRTAKAQPDPPEPAIYVSRTKNALSIKWRASRNDNGAKVLRYIVEHDQGQGDEAVQQQPQWTECYRGLNTQTKITKLQPNTTYRFRIFAENEVGLSTPSPVVAYATAGLPPSQPDPPRVVEAAAHYVVFEWEKRPGEDSYTLQLEDPSTGHGFLTKYHGHDACCTCTDLTRVTDYKVRLAAENSEGVGAYSDVINVTTGAQLPRCPSKPYVKGRLQPTSFRVQWDAPTDSGGEPVIEYVVECTGTDGFRLDHSSPDNQLLVSGVQPGQTYFVRVHACNSTGKGAPSDVCMIHTPPVAPGIPTPPALVGKPKPTGVALRWEAPESNGGEAISKYELKKIIYYEGYSSENDGVVVYYGPLKENHVEGLSAGKVYCFLVRAYNSVGPGPWSDVTQVETAPGPPDAPETLRLQAKSASVILASWKEPWSNGAPVTEYKLEQASSESPDDFTTIYTGSKLSHEIKNLNPNTEYFFRVSASNVAGSGPSSSPHSCWTPPAVPGAIQISSVSHLASPTAITLSWIAPEDNGSSITGYKIDFDGHVRVVDEPVEQFLLDGLQPDSVYRIRIQATNGIGDGPFSAPLKVKTKPVAPDAPVLEVVSVSHNNIKVKWSSVMKSSVEVEYILEMAFNKKDVFQNVYRGTLTNHKLNKVKEDTPYFFRVYAVNEAGDGPPSAVVECRTPKAPPPAVKGPKVLPAEDSCILQWSKPSQADGEDISYILQCAKANGVFVDVYKGSDLSYKYGKFEPGVSYQFRVKPVRLLSDARTIPGSWSPVTVHAVPIPSFKEVAQSTEAPVEKRRPPRRTLRQLVKGVDISDERVAIFTAGVGVLICVVLISSYILLSN